jgi:hypothetical protein
MADILFDTQTVPTTPGAGKAVAFIESVNKRLTVKDDSGRTNTLMGNIRNWSTADVVANAADTYLTGSGLAIPSGLASQAGMILRWTLAMTKTAAGTAAPVWNLRVGTAGTTADTARCVFTSPSAQTAATDTGMVDIVAILRNVGASGVIAGVLTLSHANATTGLASLGTVCLQVTSAGFDTTVAGLVYGISVNPGASAVWTHQVVSAECMNI